MKLIKNFKKLGAKEFFRRWKNGIEGITPLQQTKSQLNGNCIILFGLLCGVVVMSLNFLKYWWIVIVLLAGAFNTLITIIGTKQKIKILKQIEEQMKGGKNVQ